MSVSLLLAAIRTGGDRGRVEYEAALINVNETAGIGHAGLGRPRWMALGATKYCALRTDAAPQYRQADASRRHHRRGRFFDLKIVD
jgi:hypothetical protein